MPQKIHAIVIRDVFISTTINKLGVNLEIICTSDAEKNSERRVSKI